MGAGSVVVVVVVVVVVGDAVDRRISAGRVSTSSVRVDLLLYASSDAATVLVDHVVVVAHVVLEIGFRDRLEWRVQSVHVLSAQ